MQKKETIIRLWNEGKTIDGMLAELTLGGFTLRSGEKISKTHLKGRISDLLSNKEIKKRPVILVKRPNSH